LSPNFSKLSKEILFLLLPFPGQPLTPQSTEISLYFVIKTPILPQLLRKNDNDFREKRTI
jgi:hypothetical protein